MTSLFVSYSRKDIDCARKLTDAFKGQDFDFWIDWEGIPPTVDWWNEIERGIEQAGVFLFLVSPASLRSKVCRQEIDHALKNGKRLIPVVVRDVNAEEAPSVLSHLNWIFIRENDDFNAAFGKLITAIKTDYDWVKTHRELQVKALEWERNKYDKSFLLRGTELQFAEFQIKTNSLKDPHPTDLQQEYVLKSRQAFDKQKRLIASLAIGVVIALAALGAFGWIQAGLARNAEATAVVNEQEAIKQAATAQSAQATSESAKLTAIANEKEAKKQAKIALSRQLAAQSQVLIDEQFDLALLLAIEASRDTTDGRFALSNLLLAEPHLIRIIDSADYLGQGDSGFIEGLAFSPDGNQLVAKSYDRAGFWDFNTHESWELDQEHYQQYLDAWAPDQISSPNPDELLHNLQINDPNGTSSAVSNRVAFASCRTSPSAGGAPGCTSLIYILSEEFDRLITPLNKCVLDGAPRDFQIELRGGLYQIRGLKSVVNQPADFELYSVTLANKASNQGSIMADARYDPETDRLATAAAVERHNHELDLILWDLTDKRPVLELIRDLWDAQSAQINFSDTGAALDICVNGSGIQIDIDPKSWQGQACEIAGRNFMQTEWQQYFPGEKYRITCPQWPAGK